MSSVMESCGEGVAGRVKVSPSADDGDRGSGGKGCSDNAIVGAALAAVGEPDETLPRGGIRLTENLEDVDIRDARDPGRNGEGTLGA